MRELKECRKEIFRRSEQRLRRRRTIRTRIIGTSVVVCVLLLIWPTKFLDDTEKLGTIDTLGTGAELQYLAVEISGTKVQNYQKFENKRQVKTIYAYLNSLMEKGEKYYPIYASSDYTITFTDKYGNKVVYTLDNDTLICHQTKRSTFLTKEQLIGLKQVLNLTH